MFERFTDRARRVLQLAQDEARLLGHGFIGTEHILLGLVQEGEGLGARVLEELGVSVAAARGEVERILGAPSDAPAGPPPFTPRAKKVLELALREALELGHSYIGTEHILLGVVREGEGVAVQVLVALGAEPSLVRERVAQVMSGDSGRARRAKSTRALLRRAGEYAPLAEPRSWLEAPESCSTCGRDLWEVAHYVVAEEVRVCDACIRAAAEVLASAGTEPRELVLPPRVFGEPPDPSSVDGLVAAVRALVGPPDERGDRADVVEDYGALEPYLHELDQRLSGRVRVHRIRFDSAGSAEVRFAFGVAGGSGERSVRGRMARHGGRWVLSRAVVVAALLAAGVRVSPAGA